MKYLTDYTQEATTKALDEAGAFFAFSNKQFEEQRDTNVKVADYRNLGAGLVCPKDNVRQLLNAVGKAHNNGIKRDLEENGKEAIIDRELYNYEAFYTGDITEVVEQLAQYGITVEEIRERYAVGRKLEVA